MKSSIHLYKVAGHLFEVKLASCPFNKERMKQNYMPFELNGTDGLPLFSVTVRDDVRTDDIMSRIFSEKQTDMRFGHLEVFATSEGWFFEQTQPYSEQANARIRIDSAFKKAEIALRGNEQQCWFAFNGGVMLCYLLATAPHDTLLTHSSCVVNDGKASLFLGRSGTGKSTHSSLWLKYIAGTTLLNDDHPVIRVSPQGEVIAYGSPWSGKTPCYLTDSAPVGGIIRIKRAGQNSIVRLGEAQAYASLTTSFSGMTWETQLADSRHETIAKVIEQVPCYMLSCLPDEEAARVCHSAVTNPPEAKEDAWRNC